MNLREILADIHALEQDLEEQLDAFLSAAVKVWLARRQATQRD